MTRLLPHPAVAILIVVLLSPTLAQRREAQVPGAPVPVPRVTGPVAVTAQSYPFAAAARNVVPLDLGARGYVEEEFFVSGSANVYDWEMDRTLKVLRASVPYTTRILVRRPRNVSAFSGAVVVEPLYTARRWDWPMMWGYIKDGIMDRGDAWVGVTMPGAVAGLKRFDAARYASLTFANPTPDEPCPGTNARADVEEGLRWDALSQVAALLKSRANGAPLATLPVGAVYLTVQAGDLTTYMNAIQPAARAYDGFLARAPFAATRINRCAAAPAAADPRHAVRNVGVPVIAVAAEGDLVNTHVSRRDDSDAPADRYRLYEVAGAGHIDRWAYTGFPSMQDQAAAGNAQGTVEWPFAAPCTPPITLMEQSVLRAHYDVALTALDDWARRGRAPKRAPRIDTRPEGGSFVIVRDEFGNARGGVRSPYVDVPVASYATSSPGPGNCPEMGRATRFDAGRLRATHGSFERYAARVRESIDALTREGWITAADGPRIARELIDNERAGWR